MCVISLCTRRALDSRSRGRSTAALCGKSDVPVTPEAVLFDVGNTLLSVAEDPHVRALRGVAHLGNVSLEDYRRSLAQAQREWLEAGGTPELEDLPNTWVRHITRAL